MFGNSWEDQGADMAGGVLNIYIYIHTGFSFVSWLTEWHSKQLWCQPLHGVEFGISCRDEKRGKNNLVLKVDCHVTLIMQGFVTVSGKKLIFER